MSTFNRAPSSLNANENKEREIVGTLKQQGKNQQSETEKAKDEGVWEYGGMTSLLERKGMSFT